MNGFLLCDKNSRQLKLSVPWPWGSGIKKHLEMVVRMWVVRFLFVTHIHTHTHTHTYIYSHFF